MIRYAGVLLVFILIITVLISDVYGASVLPAQEHIYGNSSGNLINLGLFVESKDWIYYSNSFYDYKLYKIKHDGSGRIKLSDDKAVCINIMGDWIYYINLSDHSELYKARLDYSDPTSLEVTVSNFLCVVDDWIYYNDNESKLCRIKINGTGNSRLGEDKANSVNVVGDTIYYINKNDKGRIYALSTDGTNRRLVFDDIAYKLQVVDGWIYYTNNRGLYKVKIDSNQKTILAEGNVQYLNIQGEWIYYVISADTNNLYKARLDGSSRTALKCNDPLMINIVDEWIYYINGSRTPSLYRIKKDGTMNQVAW